MPVHSDISIASGDKYEVVVPFYTRALIKYFRLKESYKPGQILEIVGPTTEDPWNYADAGGQWSVKCPFFSPPQPESVWTHNEGLAMLIAKGWLRKAS